MRLFDHAFAKLYLATALAFAILGIAVTAVGIFLLIVGQ